jgi:hypothetical protein
MRLLAIALLSVVLLVGCTEKPAATPDPRAAFNAQVNAQRLAATRGAASASEAPTPQSAVPQSASNGAGPVRTQPTAPVTSGASSGIIAAAPASTPAAPAPTVVQTAVVTRTVAPTATPVPKCGAGLKGGTFDDTPFTINGSGWPAGATVYITYRGNVSKPIQYPMAYQQSVTADAAGSITATVQLAGNVSYFQFIGFQPQTYEGGLRGPSGTGWPGSCGSTQLVVNCSGTPEQIQQCKDASNRR